MAVRNLFKKPATISYPNGTMQIAEKYRGRIIYDAINCTGCGLCARDCPAGAETPPYTWGTHTNGHLCMTSLRNTPIYMGNT